MKYEKPWLEIQVLGDIEIITTSGEWKEDIKVDDLLNTTNTVAF